MAQLDVFRLNKCGNAKLTRYPHVLNIEMFDLDIYLKMFMCDFYIEKRIHVENLLSKI
jgi:hypothetical protein